MPQEFESPQEAKEYMENMGKEYRVGCFSKQKADDCHKLGAFLEAINSDYTKAGKIFQSNCDDYGYAKSCLKFGTYALLGRNLSAARPNPKQAYEYFEKGCRLKDAESCLYAGLVLISSQLKEQQDLKKGYDYLTKSCDLNNGSACFYLASMLISGAKGPIAPNATENQPLISSSNKLKEPSIRRKEYVIAKDIAKAFTFTYKACELNNIYACANLSHMYARGDGTKANEEKAEKYRRKATDLQDKTSSNRENIELEMKGY